MSKGSLAQYVVIVLTTLSSSMRGTSVAFYLVIFVIIIGAERICRQIKTVRIPARSNRLPLARSSHFPRSVDSIIGTNVAQPEHTAIVESRRRSCEIRPFPPIAWGSPYPGLGQDWLGRIEARTGLRMIPTSPRSSLRFRTAGFPSVRLQSWPIRQGLPWLHGG